MMSKSTRFRLFIIFSLFLTAFMLAAPAAAPAQVSVGVSVTIAPPPLPVYVQPICPGPGFFWVPGYWAWDPDFGYYWVPGVWVLAPFAGALWTPGYWGWGNGVYIWYEGYWGPVVGFYGGINYGFGYTGYGYDGGYWRGDRFYYNRRVNNISRSNITYFYSRNVRFIRPAGASFNGPGGMTARATSEQLAASRERRSALTSDQERQIRTAREDPKQRVTVNRGRPAVAATVKPGEFAGRGAVGATRGGAGYKGTPGRAAGPRERVRPQRPGTEMRPGTVAPERRAPGTRMERERRVQPRPAPQGRERRQVRPAPERMERQQRMEQPRPEQQQRETRGRGEERKEDRGEER